MLLWAGWLTVLAFPAAALDPHKTIKQYAHSAWGSEQGLPHTTVPAILQTRDGYMWFGTELGLARFDGVRFAVFDRKNTPELKSNVVRALAEDAQGTLWIGTDGGGLTQYRKGEFLAVSESLGQSNSAQALYPDRGGGLWIGTSGSGISRWKDGKFTNLTTKNGLGSNIVSTILQDRSGTLWIGTIGAGLSRLTEEGFSSYNNENGLGSSDVWTLEEDRSFGSARWAGGYAAFPTACSPVGRPSRGFPTTSRWASLRIVPERFGWERPTVALTGSGTAGSPLSLKRRGSPTTWSSQFARTAAATSGRGRAKG